MDKTLDCGSDHLHDRDFQPYRCRHCGRIFHASADSLRGQTQRCGCRDIPKEHPG